MPHRVQRLSEAASRTANVAVSDCTKGEEHVAGGLMVFEISTSWQRLNGEMPTEAQPSVAAGEQALLTYVQKCEDYYLSSQCKMPGRAVEGEA